MVHVKAAGGKAGPGRGISVSKYEVVTAQALKNLKFLDWRKMCQGLEYQPDKESIQRFWCEQKPAGKPELISNLKSLGTNYVRRVVIVQPHLRKVKHDEVRGKTDGIDLYRLRQLDTLLLSAEEKCRNFGAEFSVICSI